MVTYYAAPLLPECFTESLDANPDQLLATYVALDKSLHLSEPDL